MTKDNLIPNTETVYELKSEIPSFEEFRKNYQVDKSVIDSYDYELISNGEIEGYGPGNTPSSEKKAMSLTSVGMGAGMVGITVLCPPLGAAVTTTYGAAGLGMKVVGEITDNEEMAKAGEVFTMAASIGSVGSSLVGSSAGHACSACRTPGGKAIWKTN